ncbi:uncharacterized protein FIBRA_02480 [Fibroporia radiculosa]|uniref:RBR-type E3 ubiquitin transferase n=1 Tax=Fibroporia radiculosa TaxID=599839 RepID=J4G1Q2_9APHY|nr:uncharacterized protein FIBRA_02480 [Fibroporia radiculosa]CCM00448.1 predicted protein [Fibroporia radiculosa]
MTLTADRYAAPPHNHDTLPEYIDWPHISPQSVAKNVDLSKSHLGATLADDFSPQDRSLVTSSIRISVVDVDLERMSLLLPYPNSDHNFGVPFTFHMTKATISHSVAIRFASGVKAVKRIIPRTLRKVTSPVLHRQSADAASYPPRHASLHNLLSPSHDCVACQAPIHGAQVRLSCGHYYDALCLLALVEASTRDESLFPPSCCGQHIPETSFRQHMPPSLAAIYDEKHAELSTICRVYCASPACSRFLGARADESAPTAPVLRCPSASCGAHTCSRCRAAVRSGETHRHRCGYDRAQRQLFALASAQGWARCPACEHMIERRSGCFQMTCVCGARFCYLCGALWKTCGCAQWERVELSSSASSDLASLSSSASDESDESSLRTSLASLHAQGAPLQRDPHCRAAADHGTAPCKLCSLEGYMDHGRHKLLDERPLPPLPPWDESDMLGFCPFDASFGGILHRGLVAQRARMRGHDDLFLTNKMPSSDSSMSDDWSIC